MLAFAIDSHLTRFSNGFVVFQNGIIIDTSIIAVQETISDYWKQCEVNARENSSELFTILGHFERDSSDILAAFQPSFKNLKSDVYPRTSAAILQNLKLDLCPLRLFNVER